MTGTSTWVRAAAAGAALAAGVDTVTAARAHRRRRALAAAGLVTAAAIYPAASRSRPSRHETLTLGAAAAAAVVALSCAPAHGDRLLAAAWASHAAFDLAFGPEPDTSRLPGWYGPVCLGYDLAQAFLLVRRPSAA